MGGCIIYIASNMLHTGYYALLEVPVQLMVVYDDRRLSHSIFALVGISHVLILLFVALIPDAFAVRPDLLSPSFLCSVSLLYPSCSTLFTTILSERSSLLRYTAM
jgi:hypothetical protein